MTTTGHTTESLAVAVESAGFVRIVTRTDGDAFAAAGVLARELTAREIPYQVSVAATVTERTERATWNGTDGSTRDTTAENGTRPRAEPTVVIGSSNADAHHITGLDRPASLVTCELVRDLGGTPDPILGLAGAYAAGVAPGADGTEWLLEVSHERDTVERRPGVSIPTDDPVDGLAHTTLVRATWSGDPEAVRDAVDDLEGGLDDEWRAIGSLVALDVVADDAATTHAAVEVGRALHAHATSDGPFATIGGYADVLEATARTEPGTGVALAIGHGVRESALDAWREHGRRVHRALSTASTGRYDGLFVLGVDDDVEGGDRAGECGVLETVARLAAAYRSPEPVVLVVGEDAAGLAAVDQPMDETATDESVAARRSLAAERTGTDGRSAAAVVETVADSLDAGYDVGPRGGSFRYDPALDDTTVIEAVRRAV